MLKHRKLIQVLTLIIFGVLILFLGTMAFVFKIGKKLPVLPILFFLGVILTIFSRKNNKDIGLRMRGTSNVDNV